ncbi:focal adhesion kinase, partial [Salpingoeca rosetta]
MVGGERRRSSSQVFSAALGLLEKGSTQEFLVATRMLVTVIHNLCKNPNSDKYRKLKTTSEIIQQILAIPFTHDCLIACNFVKHDKYYKLQGDIDVKDLHACMDLLIEARKRKGVMEAWEVFPSDLELGDKIGSGKFGAVFEGLWNGHKVAIKTMKRATQDGMRDFEREAEVMRTLKHPNVLNLLGVVLTQQPALIVLELMGASFLSLLTKCELTDKDILDCAMQ